MEAVDVVKRRLAVMAFSGALGIIAGSVLSLTLLGAAESPLAQEQATASTSQAETASEREQTNRPSPRILESARASGSMMR